MNFASDNWAGASPKIIDAIARAGDGIGPAYGQDDLTREAIARVSALFERDVGVFFAATGTAANSLALSALCPPFGAIYAHEEAHIIGDEAGAPEFFSHGARLVGIGGIAGKLTPAALDAMAAKSPGSGSRVPVPAALSLTQATECGTVYGVDEIRALTATAQKRGLKVHMDGARFANAAATLGCSWADITWKSGVDALSLGFTKNGAFMAEIVVIFDAGKAQEIEWLRKRSGHILSKARLISAQVVAMLENDHWLDLARHANAMATMLADGLVAAGHRRAFETQANEVFAVLPKTTIARLRAEGAKVYEWPHGSVSPERLPGPDADLVRLVTSFATKPEEVERLVKLAG